MPRFSHSDPAYQAALREMGARIHELMNARGWSRADLTRAAAKHMQEGGRFGPDNTSNFVNGKRRPTRPFARALCGAFGVEESAFMPPLLIDGFPQQSTSPLLTQVVGKKDIFRLVIDRELPLKDALKIIQALDEVGADNAA